MNRAGTSLIEVLVAVVLLSVAFASLSQLTRSAARALAVAGALDQSQAWVAAMTDSIMAFGAHGAGRRELATGVLTWSVPPAPAHPAWVRFDHRALDRPVVLHFLTPAQW